MRRLLWVVAFLVVLSPATSRADDYYVRPCTPVELVLTGTCASYWPEIPDEPLCSDYIAAWLKMAKVAQAHGCSPGGPMWATVYTAKNQGDFCLSAGNDGNKARTAEMERVMSTCDACSLTVDRVMRDIVDNSLYSCGFGKGSSNLDGRWTPSRESQISRCVAAATLGPQASLDRYENANAQMDEQVRVCKLTHTNKNCVSCHESQSSAAVQAMPKGGNTLRDSLQQLPGRPKLNATDVVVDPCQPGVRGATFPCKQPGAKVIEPGMLEGGNDLLRQGPAATGTPSAPVNAPTYNRVR